MEDAFASLLCMYDISVKVYKLQIQVSFSCYVRLTSVFRRNNYEWSMAISEIQYVRFFNARLLYTQAYG